MQRSASASRPFYEQDQFKLTVISPTLTTSAIVPPGGGVGGGALNIVNKLAGSVTSLAGLHHGDYHNDHLLQLPVSCNASNKKMMMQQNHGGKVSAFLTGENSIHLIPILLVFCGFLLWLNSHPV